MPRGPGVALAGAGALRPPPCLRLELSSSGSLQKPSPVTAVPQRLALFKGPVAPSLSRQGSWLAGDVCSQASPELGGEGQQMFDDWELRTAQGTNTSPSSPPHPTPPPATEGGSKNPSLGLGFQPSDLEGAFSGKGILAAGSG